MSDAAAGINRGLYQALAIARGEGEAARVHTVLVPIPSLTEYAESPEVESLERARKFAGLAPFTMKEIAKRYTDKFGARE